MISVYHNQIMKTARVLFIQDYCPICLRWKKFIERLNLDIKPERRINVIDATNLSKYEIYNDPLFRIFDKEITNFPVLFLDGNKLTWANSREEAETFIRTYLHEDFIIPQNNEYLFKAKCRVINKGNKKEEVVCENIDYN